METCNGRAKGLPVVLQIERAKHIILFDFVQGLHYVPASRMNPK